MAKRFLSKVAVVILSVAMCTVLAYGQALAGGLTQIAEGVYSYAGADDSPRNSFAANTMPGALKRSQND